MKDKKIEVLDHGFVRLVDVMGNDLSVVRNARVSYDSAWRAGEDQGSDTRLINYLMKHSHNTPFEAVTFSFEVKAPIFVIRQWFRHRTWSFNELSARYRELPEEMYTPEASQITTQSSDNKQMRTKEPHPQSGGLQNLMRTANAYSFQAYKDLLKAGCPRELARSVLPVATYSHFFGTVNLHNLLKFLGERLHPHAQYEIQVYAEAILELIKEVVPISVEAWEKHYQRGENNA